MLKIRDDVDLKELEKFGFEKGYDFNYGEYWHNKNCFLNVHYNRVIGMWDSATIKGCIKEFSLLYDLIQAELVEKVVEE